MFGLFYFIGLKRAGHILENDLFFDSLKVTIMIIILYKIVLCKITFHEY